MRLQYSLRSAQVLAKYSRCNGFHNFLSIHHTVPNIITFSRFYSSLQYATSTSSNSFSFSFKLPLLCVTLNTFVVPRREAGHSHFANIKHTKAAMDQAKAVNIQRHIGLIRIAIRDGGGSNDPKKNTKLAQAIANALQNRVQKESISRALQKATSGGIFMVEVKIAPGVFAIAEVTAASTSLARGVVAIHAKKCGFSLMGQQANTLSTPMTRLFAHEGVVQVAQSPENLAKLATLDAATELAIEIGAEEVSEDTLVEGALKLKTYRFLCRPNSISVLREKLEARGLQVLSAESELRPLHPQRVDDEDLKARIALFYERLSAVEDVESVSDNVASDEDVADTANTASA